MLRAMLRDLRGHLGRVAMTLAAIVIGVSFVVATWVVSDSAAATVSAQSHRTDLAVRVVSAQDSPVTEDLRQRLAALPGVTAADGVTVGFAALLNAQGKLTFIPQDGATSWDSSQRFDLTDGRGPTRAGEVALERSSAREAGLTVGSSARLMLSDGTVSSGLVVGVFDYRAAGWENEPSVAFDPATARSLFGAEYRRVELYGSDQRAIATAAAATAGADFDIRTREQLTAQSTADANDVARIVRGFLLAFAGVALLVGTFVIANTFTMLVAQRTRQFALLRAVGATRRQIHRALLGEAVALGAVGAVIGIAAGIGLGWATMTLLANTGEDTVFAVSPAAIGMGFAVGVLVTVVAAYGSARRAAAVAPVAALRTDATIPRRSLVARTVLGTVAIGLGLVAVLGTANGTLNDSRRVIGMAGGLIAWLGVLLLAPMLAGAILRPLSTRLTRRARPSIRLALRNAIRDPRRTAATASALMIGLALVCAFATVGQTLATAQTEGIRGVLPAHTLMVSSALDTVEFDQSMVDRIRSASGVDGVATASVAPTDLAQVTSIDPAAIGTVLTPTVTDGSADLNRGALVPVGYARSQNLQVGRPLSLDGEAGGLTVPIAGFYQPTQILYDILVRPGTVDTSGIRTVYVTSDDPRAAKTALEQVFSQRPDILVVDRETLINETLDQLRLVLGILYALLGAAVLIAVFGVVNTLALSVLERTREIGVLRAVGANRAFVRRSVRGESVVIATYGGVLGVAVGLLLGGVMQHVLIGRPILEFTIPWTTVGVALAGMVLIGVIAALWPARRAARTNILTAIN